MCTLISVVKCINTYKPVVLFMGHWQAVKTQIRRSVAYGRCIDSSLQNILSNFEYN